MLVYRTNHAFMLFPIPKNQNLHKDAFGSSGYFSGKISQCLQFTLLPFPQIFSSFLILENTYIKIDEKIAFKTTIGVLRKRTETFSLN